MAINNSSFKTLFISEQTLKDNSIINDNVDMLLLNPIITLVQEIQIERLLGSSLYVHLQDAIQSETLNDDELFLLEAYIQPCMIWGILKEAPIYMTYKFAGKGIEKMNSDNSQPAGRDELEMLADMANSKFGYYSERLIKYLIFNQSKYPNYNRIDSPDDVLPKRNGYRSRIALSNPYTPEQWAKVYRNRDNNGYKIWDKRYGC